MSYSYYVEIDEGQPSMKNLKEFTQVLLLATVKPKTCQFDTDKRLLLLYRKIVNLVLHVKKIPAKSTTTNFQRFSTLELRGYSVSEFNNQVVFEVLIKLCFLPSHDDVLGRKQIVSNWLPTIRVI